MNSDQNKIVIFAAGTGGHIYPGISIAKELIQNGFSVLWVGTKKGIENKIVPEAEILIEYVNFSGLRGKGLFAYIKLPFNLLRAIIQSIVLIRKYKPQIALSMGGYISFPCCIASYLLRIPIVIHEQNIIFGMANNILRHLSKKVILVTETRGLCSIHHQQQHKKLRALGDEFLPRSNPVTGIFNSTAPAFGFAHGPDTKVNRLVKIKGVIDSSKNFYFEFKEPHGSENLSNFIKN